jgi:hypothetical protein
MCTQVPVLERGKKDYYMYKHFEWLPMIEPVVFALSPVAFGRYALLVSAITM